MVNLVRGEEWEEAGIFPAHQVFKGLGDLGLTGEPEGLDGRHQALLKALGMPFVRRETEAV